MGNDVPGQGPVQRMVRPGAEALPPDAGPLICWRAGERVCTIEQALAYRAQGVAAERERCVTAVFAWAHDAIDRKACATFSAPTAAEQIVKRL